jgi:hypothetical protein
MIWKVASENRDNNRRGCRTLSVAGRFHRPALQIESQNKGLPGRKQATLIPEIRQKKVSNMLDLSVILVTLGTPGFRGKTEDGRFAHFLFVGRIRHGFERVTGDDC